MLCALLIPRGIVSCQLRQQIAQLEESRTALQAASSYIVRSPVSGQIIALQGNVGQSLNPNLPVMVIVPDGAELIATLLVPTRLAGLSSSDRT